jgi:hypothetical protein
VTLRAFWDRYFVQVLVGAYCAFVLVLYGAQWVAGSFSGLGMLAITIGLGIPIVAAWPRRDAPAAPRST